MSRPVVFSASSISTYLECGLRWWFTYVAAFPARPSLAMATGVAVHAAAETVLRGKMTGWPVSEQEALAAYRQAMEEAGHSPDEAGSALVRLFMDEVAPKTSPLLVETPFQIEVNGIPYSGIFDWYDSNLVLHDLKTSASRPSARNNRYRIAMIGYALGARDLTGREETGIVLDYLVKTKTPYYWPVASPPASEADIAEFAATVETVAEAVARRVYDPDGLFKGACRYCPFTQECGPYLRLAKEGEGEAA